MCDYQMRLEKCEHFSNYLILECSCWPCQLCLRFLTIFCDFRHFGPDHFSDFFGQKTYLWVGIRMSACVFSGSAKIAVSLEITAIRCKQRTPAISLWSLNNGGDGGSRTHVQEYFRKTFSERSRLIRFRSPVARTANSGLAIP